MKEVYHQPSTHRHQNVIIMFTRHTPYLERDKLVVDNRVLRQEVRPNGRLVLRRKPLVDVLVHQGRLPDTATQQ